MLQYLREHKLQLVWIMETHAHADHLSAAPYLRQQMGGKIVIGNQITRVQEVFKGIFNLEPDFKTDGSQFDELWADGQPLRWAPYTGE